MPLGNATVTGVTGNAQTITAGVVTDIRRLEYAFEDNLVRIAYGNPEKIMEISMTGLTTTTMTAVATAPVIVIS